MREFFGWARWTWQQQETWQKWWIFAMFCLGAGWSAEGMAQTIILGISISIFGFYFAKWAIWDAFKSSWAKYQEHRNSLLTTIKTSDKE